MRTQPTDTELLRNLERIVERLKKGLLPIYTCDCETDPFKRGQVPQPFVIGFYDGHKFRYFWSNSQADCILQLKYFLESRTVEPGIIYMHNGGRFDFFYLLDFFEGRTTIINSRIVKALMPLIEGKHRFEKGYCYEFRDSFAIMPFPLKAYMKDDLPIDYLLKENREAKKQEILSYLFGDCSYLWDLCIEFQREFGDYVTIASAAFTQLTNFHSYEQLPMKQDSLLRNSFYFGGRVQCFEKGLMKGPVRIYDVNSMYPYVMQEYLHPISWMQAESTQLMGWKEDQSKATGKAVPNREKLKTFFLTVEGQNRGAFPLREKDGSVSFEVEHGVFHVSIHEWFAALKTKTFIPSKGRGGNGGNNGILCCYNFSDYSKFHQFVSHFYKLREDAKKAGDKMHTLFYKYILNSAYGKFGLNPENYYNWRITRTDEKPPGKDWEPDLIVQGKFYVWKQPSQTPWNVKNIGAAASITGAARSVLLAAIADSRRVLYCDTDSILCGQLKGSEISDYNLGAWKLEAEGTSCAIAGKKMYAVFKGEECIKQANKGVDLSPLEIVRLANGEEILTCRDAPTFKRDGSAVFISRKVKMT